MSIFNLFKSKKKEANPVQPQPKDTTASDLICPLEFQTVCLGIGDKWLQQMNAEQAQQTPSFARFMAFALNFLNQPETDQAVYFSALTEGCSVMLSSLHNLLSGREWDDVTEMDPVDAVQNYHTYYTDGHFSEHYLEKIKNNYPPAASRQAAYTNFLTQLCNFMFAQYLLHDFAHGDSAKFAEKISARPADYQPLIDTFFGKEKPQIMDVLYTISQDRFLSSPAMQAEIKKRVK